MAYRTVFLKQHFTLEYFSALLSLYMDTPSRLQLYLSEARRKGIRLLRPDINQSEIGFKPETLKSTRSTGHCQSLFENTANQASLGEKSSMSAIRAGFALVKNLGPRGIKQILKAREEKSFSGFFDFCQRIDRRAVSTRALESLILAGAFDGFGIARPALLLSAKPALMQKRAIPGQISLFPEESPIKVLAEDVLLPDFSPEEKAYHELQALGHYITCHPMELHEEWARNLRTHTAEEVSEINCKKKVCLAGILLDPRLTHRNRSRMMFVQLEDLTGSVELVVFRENFYFMGLIFLPQSPYLLTAALTFPMTDIAP